MQARRRIRPVDDRGWIAADLSIGPCEQVVAAFEPDRTWCLPGAGAQGEPTRIDPLWRMLDRWSRSGTSAVRTGAPDVYRVIRLPVRDVRRAVADWSSDPLLAGKSSLRVSPSGAATLRGVFHPHRTHAAQVEIEFEPWSSSELCAHLRPVGRSIRRMGSAAWWNAAHDVLDLVVERLAAAGSEPVAAGRKG